MSFLNTLTYFLSSLFLSSDKPSREVWGYTAEGIGGRLAGACIFVQDSASHSQLLPTWSLWGKIFLSPLWTVVDSHFPLESAQRFAFSPQPNCGRTQGISSKQEVCVWPLLLPLMWQKWWTAATALMMVSSSEAGSIHTSFCCLYQPHWHAKQFLSRFFTETCEHFKFVIVSVLF